MSRLRRPLSLHRSGLALATLAFTAGAQAQDLPSRPLEESVTVSTESDACMSAEPLRHHIASWLSTDAVDARIAIVVDVESARVASFVVLRGEEVIAARRFERLPPQCADRRAAVSLAIAMAIDHTILERMASGFRPEPPSGPTSAGEAPADGEGAESEAPSESSPPSPLSLFGLLSGQVLVDVLPELAAGGGVGLELQHRRTYGLRASFLFTSNARASVGGGSADVRLIAGRLDACVFRSVERFRLGGCVGGAAGVVIAEGQGFPITHHTSAGWSAAIAHVSGRVDLAEAVHLGLFVEGILPLLRPNLTVRTPDGGTVSERGLPTVGFSAGLELGLRIW